MRCLPLRQTRFARVDQVLTAALAEELCASPEGEGNEREDPEGYEGHACSEVSTDFAVGTAYRMRRDPTLPVGLPSSLGGGHAVPT